MSERYENHLRGAGKRENTVSTYLRMLKAAYRRAVREKIVEDYDPMLFSDVGTGTRAGIKRAIEPDVMSRILNADLSALPKSLRTACVRASLMYRFRGMSFADYAYLPAEGLQPKKRLTYKRKKTGRALTALVSAETQALIDLDANPQEGSDYLSPSWGLANGGARRDIKRINGNSASSTIAWTGFPRCWGWVSASVRIPSAIHGQQPPSVKKYR